VNHVEELARSMSAWLEFGGVGMTTLNASVLILKAGRIGFWSADLELVAKALIT
jgi:hypothetical protein